MAGVLIGAQTGEIAFTLATGTITLAQIVAAANHRVIVHSITVSFNGISATDEPLRIQVLRQTDAGTMSALTVQKLNVGDNETVQTTAQHTSTAAPSDGVIFASAYVHPQRSMTFVGPFPVLGGERLGVKIISPAQNGECVVSFRGEE